MSLRKRYFTPDEANALLPLMVGRLEAIRIIAAELRELAASFKRRLEQQIEPISADEAQAFRDRQAQAESLVQSIKSAGVELKALEPGLLDFPALRLGREVYLCWREGEDAITFWHPIETGIAGRQPLGADDADLWEWVN